MKDVKILGADWINGEAMDLPWPVTCYNNFVVEHPHRSGVQVLLLFSEPPPFRPGWDVISKNLHKFDLILTWDSQVLVGAKQARWFPFGTTWAHWPESGTEPKDFRISFLVGGKMVTGGHLLRQSLWGIRESLGAPGLRKDFYVSRNFPIPGQEPVYPWQTKRELFDGVQFHICIENDRLSGWFTEKVMDCFGNRVVPIYWGDPSICTLSGFDPSGMIICQSREDIVNAISSLTPETYGRMKAGIDFNFEHQKQWNQHYVPLETRLAKAILSGISGT